MTSRFSLAAYAGKPLLLVGAFAFAMFASCAIPLRAAVPARPVTLQTPSDAAPTLYTAEQLSTLLPPSVYFAGQSATLQVRNAGAVRFRDGLIAWAALVDTGGYATDVVQKYQFYFVTERELTFGGKRLPAGAYGAGFVADDRFLVMDIGGHVMLEGATQTEASLKRPRPLQIVAESGSSVRLYLGRRWVSISH